MIFAIGPCVRLLLHSFLMAVKFNRFKARANEIRFTERNWTSHEPVVRKIYQKIWQDKIQEFLKTEDGNREIDLHSSVAALLREFIGD